MRRSGLSVTKLDTRWWPLVYVKITIPLLSVPPASKPVFRCVVSVSITKLSRSLLIAETSFWHQCMGRMASSCSHWLKKTSVATVLFRRGVVDSECNIHNVLLTCYWSLSAASHSLKLFNHSERKTQSLLVEGQIKVTFEHIALNVTESHNSPIENKIFSFLSMKTGLIKRRDVIHWILFAVVLKLGFLPLQSWLQ